MVGPRDVSLGAVSVPVFGCCIWFLCGRCLGPRLDVWVLQLDVWVLFWAGAVLGAVLVLMNFFVEENQGEQQQSYKISQNA